MLDGCNWRGSSGRAPFQPLEEFSSRCSSALREADVVLYELLHREQLRQNDTLMMVAAGGLMDPSVMACAGSALGNVTGEGYPDARFHAGCEVVDAVERLAIARAKSLFGAQYANVQPHSGTAANLAVIAAVFTTGDKILGLDLKCGGHLSHGAKPSITGRHFGSVSYGLDDAGLIDYDQVLELARVHRPRIIICGASAYPRQVDFARFRMIADAVGAFLMADISHIAGLIAGGQHPSPINHAHFTTTSTYKQLGGPRGGAILMGRDADSPSPWPRLSLSQMLQRAVFPMCQGTPNFAEIAAKARGFDIVAGAGFRELAARTVANARAMAAEFAQRDYRVVTGGTDTHMVLLDLRPKGLTGVAVEQALESLGIVTNRNAIPGDSNPLNVAGGLRLGTHVLSMRGMGVTEILECVDLIDTVVCAMSPAADLPFDIGPEARERIERAVRRLCRRFPLPGYELADCA